LQNMLLICEYGSDYTTFGFRISFLDVYNSSIELKTLISGYLTTINFTNFVWGRPTGILVQYDGSILISDDKSGTIIRVSALPSNLVAYILILVAIVLSIVTTVYILFHNLCLDLILKNRNKKLDTYVEFQDEKGKNIIPAVELQ